MPLRWLSGRLYFTPPSVAPMGQTVCIADRLFNGLTANDRWHRIYRSQQRSLSLSEGLMLAETGAQTDASDY